MKDRFQLRIDSGLKEAAKKKADSSNKSLNVYIEELIREDLSRSEVDVPKMLKYIQTLVEQHDKNVLDKLEETIEKCKLYSI